MGIINRIIKTQPKLVKKIYYEFVPFKYRYGKLFIETCNFLDDVDTWSYDRSKEYQFNQLKFMLSHCKNNVPYYGKLFANYEFNINIQSFNDIKKLPLLTKDVIIKNTNDLMSKNFNGKKILFKTSGSTGKRLEFFGDDSIYKKEAAYIQHSFKSHGADLYNDWSIWIRRHSPKDMSDLVVKDYELKRIYISPFHLNEDTIYFYVDLINNSKSKTIVTYPSTAYWLSCLLEKNNLKLPNITSIHGASEKCLDYWGDKIKNVFGFNLKMHYGQVEKVSFMYQSNDSEFYHNDLTYSYTEFDDNNTIIGTSFINYVMPFIRYKTNDVVTLNKSVKYDTPRPLMVTKIDGRVDDMIISDNNAKIPSVNFYTVMSKVEEITMFQLYQKIDKSLNLKIVIKNNFNFSNDLLNLLRSEINKRVGNLPLNFEIVNEIPRDVNTGKIRCVITEIK
jgi:phenylacetate-CoA ligase